MKRFMLGVFSLTLVLFSSLSCPVYAQDELQVQERFQLINNKYRVGDPFSKEDAAFVQAHSQIHPQRGITPSRIGIPFIPIHEQNETTQTKDDIKVNIKGSTMFEYGLISGKYGVNVVAKLLTGTPTRLNQTFRIIGYGFEGIGKVVDQSLTATSTTNVCRLNQQESFYGLVVQMFREYSLEVITKEGKIVFN